MIDLSGVFGVTLVNLGGTVVFGSAVVKGGQINGIGLGPPIVLLVRGIIMKCVTPGNYFPPTWIIISHLDNVWQSILYLVGIPGGGKSNLGSTSVNTHGSV